MFTVIANLMHLTSSCLGAGECHKIKQHRMSADKRTEGHAAEWATVLWRGPGEPGGCTL